MPKRVIAKTSIYMGIYMIRIDIYVMSTPKDVGNKVKQLCKKNNDTIVGVVDEACGYTASFTKDAGVFHLLYSVDCLDINIVTHETDHLRSFIMEYKDIHDEEASANLNGYLNELVFKFLRSKNFSI